MNAQDEDDDSHSYPLNPTRRSDGLPNSPPPSFRSGSRSTSPSSRRLLHSDSVHDDNDQTLADAFGDGDESDDDEEPDDRQRLMRGSPDTGSHGGYGQPAPSAYSSSDARINGQEPPRITPLSRRPTILPTFTTPTAGSGRSVAPSNDGVFANLAAKPERGEKTEDLPPVSLFLVPCA